MCAMAARCWWRRARNSPATAASRKRGCRRSSRQPDGRIVEEPYRARITDTGNRHPVTRELPGSELQPPAWGEWLRIVGSQVQSGSALMSGANDLPLLVLRREEKGRVALLLSDHAWLWARGYNDGGPHLDLLRRLAHWLMKEPALEEEALRASSAGRAIRVERQTMKRCRRSGHANRSERSAERRRRRARRSPGCSPPRCKSELGLHTLRSGDLVAFVSIGPANPRELTDVFSNTEPCAPSRKRPAARSVGSPSRAIGASRCRGSSRSVPARACRGRLDRYPPERQRDRPRGLDPAAGARIPRSLLLVGATVVAWIAEGRRRA